MRTKIWKRLGLIRSIAVTTFLLFLNSASPTLAQTATSNSTTQSSSSGGILGLLALYWICNGRKDKAIGGWLLFYYIELYGGLVFLILLWSTGATFNFAGILLIVELILASLLLFKRFRNKKFYNFLRLTFVAQFGLGIINLFLFQEDLVLGFFPITIALICLLYFSFSKRVRLVLVENKWDTNPLYPAKSSILASEKMVMSGVGANTRSFEVNVDNEAVVNNPNVYLPYLDAEIDTFIKKLGSSRIVERDGIIAHEWRFVLKSDGKNEKAFITEAMIAESSNTEAITSGSNKWAIYAESSESAKALFDYLSGILR